MVSVSPTRNELLLNLIEYTELSTGLSNDRIIRGKQNAPAPTGAYCTITYINHVANGLRENKLSTIVNNDNELTEVTTVQKIYSYSVQFYRDNAADLGMSFMLYYQTLEAQVFFMTSLFTIKSIDNISESGDIVSKNYQERAIMTVDLYVRENIFTIINKVDEIDINIKYNELEDNIKVVRE